MRAVAYGIWQVLGLSYSNSMIWVCGCSYTLADSSSGVPQHSAFSTQHTQHSAAFNIQHCISLQPALGDFGTQRAQPQLGVSAHFQHSALSRSAPGLGAQRSALPARQQALGVRPPASALGVRHSALGVRRSAFGIPALLASAHSAPSTRRFQR
jgi:hypothetical protein